MRIKRIAILCVFAALTLSASQLSAEPTCWLCVSENGRMYCVQVPCEG
ncbi:hypothetical protein [Lysobacter sp. cf310]|nr:hypothetical protein [Lysobacter sp. cf310]SFL20238.1 hypothetical protein SAMN04487938_3644 [Lysobacter sp. cf310]